MALSDRTELVELNLFEQKQPCTAENTTEDETEVVVA